MSKEKLIPELRFSEFKNECEWEEVEFGKLKLDVSDGNYSSKYPSQSDFLKSGVPFIRSNNLKNGTVVDEDMRFISAKQHSEITKGHLKEGDILLSTRGELGTVALVPKKHIGSNINAQLVRINTSNILSNTFLFYLFELNRLNKIFDSLSTGTALKQLPIGKLNQLKLLLPKNPKEQQKIASCLSSLDEVIAAHSQKLDLLKDHKKGLMQNLFPQEGEKVPKVRFKEFEKDGEWVEEILGDVIKYFKGFAFQSTNYTSSGRRIIRVSDMGFDYIKYEENAIYINESDAIQYEKWQLKKGDLIITTVGSKPPMYDSLVGRTIIVKSKDENALLNQNAVCLRANSKIAQGFLNTLTKKSEYVNFIETIIRGNANQGSIALEDLFKYKFLKPKNPKEQQKIASCLSSLDALITAQAEKIEQLKLHKKGLMQGLFPRIKE